MITTNTLKNIFLEAIPVLIMVGLIPIVSSDYLLSLIYIAIVLISFKIKYIKNEYVVFITGFIAMIIFEYLFVLTGVETFTRNSLFNAIPIWIPILWGYGFVAIRRAGEYLIK